MRRSGNPASLTPLSAEAADQVDGEHGVEAVCGNEANRDQKAPQVASQLNLYALAVVTLRSQGGSPLEATFPSRAEFARLPCLVRGKLVLRHPSAVLSPCWKAVPPSRSRKRLFAQQQSSCRHARSVVGGVVCLCTLQRERPLDRVPKASLERLCSGGRTTRLCLERGLQTFLACHCWEQ